MCVRARNATDSDIGRPHYFGENFQRHKDSVLAPLQLMSIQKEVVTNNLICFKALFLVGSHLINTSFFFFSISTNMLMNRHEKETVKRNTTMKRGLFIDGSNWRD